VHLWESCTSSSAWTWFYDSMKLLTSAELCNILPRNATIFMIGDSLTAQLVWSWSSRLLADRIDSDFEPKFQVGIDRRQVDVPTCTHGGSVRQPGQLRVSNLILQETLYELKASDLRCGGCVKNVTLDPSRFGLQAYTMKELENLLQGSQVVVLNQHAHIFKFISALEKCYFLSTGSTSGAKRLAKRDAMRFWATSVGSLASFFGNLVSKRNGDFAAFYRTSPPAADMWLLRDRNWRSNNFNSSHYEPQCPADILATEPPKWEYGHELYATMNDVSVAAFKAAGLGLIDLEWMLGVRTDAHPGPSKYFPGGDALHFCLPGVPDYALDEILRTIRKRISK